MSCIAVAVAVAAEVVVVVDDEEVDIFLLFRDLDHALKQPHVQL